MKQKTKKTKNETTNDNDNNDKKINNNNETTTTTKQKTKKFDITKIDLNKMSNDEKTFVTNYLLNELTNATIRRDKCRIRNMLRKYCQHYGALRQRTYVDKKTNERHIVTKSITTNAK